MSVSAALINLAIVVLLSPLFEGILRKLRAVAHSRKGPPLWQPYLDILKLLVKEDVVVSGDPFFRLAPYLAVAGTLTLALMVPMGAGVPFGKISDIIVLVGVAELVVVALLLGSIGSGTPFSLAGGGREVMMALMAEPTMAAALLVAASKAESLNIADIAGWCYSTGVMWSTGLAGLALFLTIQPQLAKIPFDIPEAETEISGGALVEFSGPRLALFKFALYARQLILGMILVRVFVPWPRTGIVALDVALNLAKVFLLSLFVWLAEVLNPRLRIDQMMAFYGRAALVLAAALAFAVIGW